MLSGGSLMSDFMKRKRVLYSIYFVPRDCCILDFFSNLPVKYDKAEGRF
jgi:hypothetical protein